MVTMRAHPQPRTYANGRYVAGGKRAKGKSPAGRAYDALRYMQMRELGPGERPEDRRFFGAVGEGGSWAAARQIIMEHATARVAYHRLILSPGQEVGDMQEWTHMVMDDLADRLGQELHWVAVVHRNTEHPHVHILIAGGGERDEELYPVVLRREHYTLLRASGDRGAAHLRELGQDRVTGLRRLTSREERQAARAAQEAADTRVRINARPSLADKGRDEQWPAAEDLARSGATEAVRKLARMFRQMGGSGSDPTLEERDGPER
jgi:hypothetical protein